MGVGDFAVDVEHRRVALEAHDADHGAVAQFEQFQFEFGDERIGVAVADETQAGGFFAERDALVFRAADADADDDGRAGQAAVAEGDERVDEEPLEAGDAVAGEEHAVVAAEEAAFVDGGEVDPVAFGLEAVVDARRHDADVVAGVAAGERMNAVGAKRHVFGGAGGGGAQGAFEGDEAAFELHVVAGLHVEAGQAGVAAHGALLADGDIGVIDDGEQGPLGVGVGFALGGFDERVLGIERHGDGRAAVEFVGNFFEFFVGDSHLKILICIAIREKLWNRVMLGRRC